jgi:hypothetical protein
LDRSQPDLRSKSVRYCYDNADGASHKKPLFIWAQPVWNRLGIILHEGQAHGLNVILRDHKHVTAVLSFIDCKLMPHIGTQDRNQSMRL